MPDTYTKARLKEKGTTNFLHPETEVAQLMANGGTPLAGIISTLLKAATTSEARNAIEAAAASHQHSTGDITNFASQVVSAIGTETLDALGVKYSITTNGYICFGQLFGGLILQWGDPAQIVWPIDPETGHEIDHSKAIDITSGGGGGGGSFDFQPHIYVTTRKEGCTVTCTSNGKYATSEVLENGVIDFKIPAFGDWTISCSKDGYTRQDVINISEIKIYNVTTSNGRLFGFRIYDPEADPSERVEYLYDAVGMTPAHMDYTKGVFDYGDWGDVWFVKNNKPCMLKRDGTVDYYLDPDDYTKKADGTASDVANLSYDGNAMSEIPLCYVKRYSDGDYNYVIVSDIPYDEDYKAYAHTNASGEIKEAFHYSCFGGSGNSSMIRSIAGQTRVGSLNATNEIQGCVANGSGWYTHTWSQYSLIRDLLVLMGKSTDAQTVFGGGNAQSASSASYIKQTGTLKDKGQFYGYNNYANQVKVFHIEAFWGDMWDRLAGLISVNYRIWTKMTPEDPGYRITDTTGYTDTECSVPSLSASYTQKWHCTEYGMFPKTAGGSGSTYYPDQSWSASGTTYLFVGASVNDSSVVAGPFSVAVHTAASFSYWALGCGLSHI